MAYITCNMNNSDCWHRLPCGVCRLTNLTCPKNSNTYIKYQSTPTYNTGIKYPTYDTNTSQTAVGKPDENTSIKVTGEKE